MSKRPLITLITALSLLFIFPGIAFSKDAEISDIKINGGSQSLKVSFNVTNGFTEDIEEAILSGIPTAFTFFVELYREKSFRFDDELAALTFRHIVKYDNLKKEFEVTLEENPGTTLRFKELEEVKEVMVKGVDVHVASMLALEPGRRFKMNLKAELHTIRLPFPLRYVLFFVSFWDFETDWESVRFKVTQERRIEVIQKKRGKVKKEGVAK